VPSSVSSARRRPRRVSLCNGITGPEWKEGLTACPQHLPAGTLPRSSAGSRYSGPTKRREQMYGRLLEPKPGACPGRAVARLSLDRGCDKEMKPGFARTVASTRPWTRQHHHEWDSALTYMNLMAPRSVGLASPWRDSGVVQLSVRLVESGTHCVWERRGWRCGETTRVQCAASRYRQVRGPSGIRPPSR